jgi:hypothetical protein
MGTKFELLSNNQLKVTHIPALLRHNSVDINTIRGLTIDYVRNLVPKLTSDTVRSCPAHCPTLLVQERAKEQSSLEINSHMKNVKSLSLTLSTALFHFNARMVDLL